LLELEPMDRSRTGAFRVRASSKIMTSSVES
jgi:hypothetical protein